MTNDQPKPVRPEASTPAAAAPAPEAQRAPFERPRVRRLGALPAVTTAFGGSFTP
jgi:hypothetical protein